MQKEIATLIESMTKKRDELDAAIGALSRVRLVEKPRHAAVVAAPQKRKRYPKMKWSAAHRAKFIASMAARKAKANGAIAGEGPTSVVDTPQAS